MLIYYRYTNGLPKKIFVGIPITQWRSEVGNDNTLQTYAIIPLNFKGRLYCEVHIVSAQSEEWYFASDEEVALDLTSFGFPALTENLFIKTSKQTDEDLYFVWDDGAENHMNRAERLYKTFEDLIRSAKI